MQSVREIVAELAAKDTTGFWAQLVKPDAEMEALRNFKAEQEKQAELFVLTP